MLDSRTPGVLVHDDDDLPLRSQSAAAALGAGTAAGGAPCMAGLVARLQASIADHACERRAAGVPLERVLAEVRELVRDAELAEGWPDELGILAGRVTRWATEAYLDDPELRSVPRFY